MTAFMASVRNVEEARLALAGGADLIDLKEPSAGSLGAVSLEQARLIVEAARGLAVTSATIGDVPLDPSRIVPAVLGAAESGADVVKVGLFPGDLDACLPAFAKLSEQIALAAIVFADKTPFAEAVALPERLARAGFRAIILDTAGKEHGRLLDHWPLHDPQKGMPVFGKGSCPDRNLERDASTENHRALTDLAAFLAKIRALNLIAGLAGSLRADDIAHLLPLAPDMLGFRGALCEGSRRDALSAARILAVRQAIPRNPATVEHIRAIVKLRTPPAERIPPMAPDNKILAARFLSPHPRADQPVLDKVRVMDLVLPVRIGVWSEEQGITQRVRFSVELSVFPAPRASEDVNQIISYDFIIDGIKAILAEGHVLLVETLAERIAEHCLSDRRAAMVRVLAEKLDRVPGASLGCEIIRRQKSVGEANVYSILAKRGSDERGETDASE
jgi:dihydroneopterin aldolase